MSLSSSRSCTEEWVNTIRLLTHCIKAPVNNVCWIGPPPACTQEVQSSTDNIICFARTYQIPDTQLHSHASKGVHSSMDIENNEIFTPMHACMQKGQTRNKTRRCTCTNKAMRVYTHLKAFDVSRQSTKKHTSKHAQVLHTLFLSLSGRVALQCLAGDR